MCLDGTLPCDVDIRHGYWYQAAETQSYFEEMMGKPLGEDEPFETVDDVLHACFDQIRKESEARARAKTARKNKRGRSAYMQQADQLLEDSDQDCLQPGARKTCVTQCITCAADQKDPARTARPRTSDCGRICSGLVNHDHGRLVKTPPDDASKEPVS